MDEQKVFNDVTDGIENPGTQAILAIANHEAQFRNIAGGISYVLTLTKLLSMPDSLFGMKLAIRIGALLGQRYDTDYEHPRDVIIALYLLCLEKSNSPYAVGVAGVVYDFPNLFWSRKVARTILNNHIPILSV